MNRLVMMMCYKKNQDLKAPLINDLRSSTTETCVDCTTECIECLNCTSCSTCRKCVNMEKSYNNIKLQNNYLKNQLNIFKDKHKFCNVTEASKPAHIQPLLF